MYRGAQPLIKKFKTKLKLSICIQLYLALPSMQNFVSIICIQKAQFLYLFKHIHELTHSEQVETTSPQRRLDVDMPMDLHNGSF